MKSFRSTTGGLVQGVMAGVVLFIALFTMMLIARVDRLRNQVESRVIFIGAAQNLESAAPGTELWEKATATLDSKTTDLMFEADLEPALRNGLLILTQTLDESRSPPSASPLPQPLQHRMATELSQAISGAKTLVRDSNRDLSTQLGQLWRSLYVLMYVALGLCVWVMALLLFARGRYRRAEELHKHLQRELETSMHTEESLRARETREAVDHDRAAALTEANERLRGEVESRRRAQREAQRIQGELIQAQKMESLGKLAGGVAHDFNNLLAAIRGNTELLLRRLDPSDPRRRYGEDVVQATLRAEALTLQLLAFSRHQTFDPKPIDLPTLIQNFRSLLKPLLREDVALETDFQSLRYVIRGDQNQVEQVLLNLAVNARDSMPRGGRIRISAEHLDLDASAPEIHPEVTPGPYVRLTVEDNGQGIPAEILPRIFEPFFTTKGPGEGSGLGLSVVYGIVRHHGGWVDVESSPGEGTSFHVHFPTTDQEPEHRPASVPSKIPPPQGERILIVEDEDAVRELGREVLFEEGYEVECAESLAAARAAVEDAPGFDLLFTDMALPDGDGLNLATELQDRDPTLKVLLTSGYVDHLARWPLIRERGYRLLRKPYLIAALQAAVREVLDAQPTAEENDPLE